MLTFAAEVPEFLTRYLKMATGKPESSGSCGMKGEKASRLTDTGREESRKSMCASGYSLVKTAPSRRLSPGALSEPRPCQPS